MVLIYEKYGSAWELMQFDRTKRRNMDVRSLRERGGRIFLIGDLNYNNIYLSVISILYIDALYYAIQDNKYPLALKSKLHN